MIESGEQDSADASRTTGGYTLVASRRSWLVSSLRDILASMDLGVRQARTAEATFEAIGREVPDLVLVDSAVAPEDGDGAADVCRELAEEHLPPSVPIVLYTPSSFASADLHAEALEAGAWVVLSEPLEAATLIALFRRLRRVSELITVSRTQEELVDAETGLLTLAGLRQVLPSLGALAVRNQSPLSLVVLGPTVTAEQTRDVRRRTAEITSPNVRSADVCAWVNGDQLLVVAYDTPAEGARQMVRRLNQAAEGLPEGEAEGRRLSAGIVELRPREDLEEAVGASRRVRPGREEVSLPQFRDLFSLSAAQEALFRARQSGGGVQVVNGV